MRSGEGFGVGGTVSCKVGMRGPGRGVGPGEEEGDVAEVQAPGGVRRYEIVGVSYI